MIAYEGLLADPMVQGRKHTLDLIGPANTGKTLFIKLASVFLRVMKTHIYMYIYIYLFIFD